MQSHGTVWQFSRGVDYMLTGHWTDEHYVEHFRMRRAHFMQLAAMIEPYVAGGYSHFKEPISVVRKLFAVKIYQGGPQRCPYPKNVLIPGCVATGRVRGSLGSGPLPPPGV